MLLRMYSRWGNRRGFAVRELEVSAGDQAGIKSATLELEGRFAFGYLLGEKGTHRLVRQSPFNAKGLRQVCTSLPSSFTLLSPGFLGRKMSR